VCISYVSHPWPRFYRSDFTFVHVLKKISNV
jgi:hypothetical protein